MVCRSVRRGLGSVETQGTDETPLKAFPEENLIPSDMISVGSGRWRYNPKRRKRGYPTSAPSPDKGQEARLTGPRATRRPKTGPLDPFGFYSALERRF